MDKVNELNSRLDDILAEYSSIDNIGYDELKDLWQRIDALKNEANAYSQDILVGITREPNGRFKSRDNIEIDIHDIAQITSGIDSFTDRAYEEISRINALEREKREMFFDRGREVIELTRLMRNNDTLIENLRNEIADLRSQLGDPNLSPEMLAELESRGITYTPSESNLTPERRFYLEQELAAKLISLDTFEKANEMYRIQEERLREEMEILKNGGELELEPETLEPEEIERTSEPVPTGTGEPEIDPEELEPEELDSEELPEELDPEELDPEEIIPPELDPEDVEEGLGGDESTGEPEEEFEVPELDTEHGTPTGGTGEDVPSELDPEDEVLDEEDIIGEEPERPRVTGNKPKLTWKTVASVAVGIGIGATAFFAVGPLGVTIMSIGTMIAKKFINKRRKELARMRMLGTPIEATFAEPRPGLRGKIDKLKNYLKSEEGLRDISWMLNSALITGIGLTVGNALHNSALFSGETGPMAPGSDVVAETTVTEAETLATSAPEPLGYDGIRIGEAVGDYNVSVGHDTAGWAVNGVNPEALASQYVNESSVFSRFASINADGTLGQIIDTNGLSITEFCAQNGLDPTQIAVDVAKNGTSQAWISADQLISGIGGPKI